MAHPERHDRSPHRFLVIDSHEVTLAGIVPNLQSHYPTADIVTAKDIEAAQRVIEQQRPTLITMDLRLPTARQEPPSVPATMRFLEQLLHSNLTPQLMIISDDIRPLIQLQPVINAYQGGFVALNKFASLKEILNAANIALQGSIYLPTQVRSRPEFEEKWLRVLTLKYEERLSDKAIAQDMDISDRTVRNYWSRIQNALNVHDDPRKDLRLQIQQAAQQAGLVA